MPLALGDVVPDAGNQVSQVGPVPAGTLNGSSGRLFQATGGALAGLPLAADLQDSFAGDIALASFADGRVMVTVGYQVDGAPVDFGKAGYPLSLWVYVPPVL